MTPDKALEMVGKYARLTKLIKSLTIEIGANLDLCKGADGKPRHHIHCGTIDELMVDVGADHTDRKGRDTRTHLWSWYNEPVDQRDDGDVIFERVSPSHSAVCGHCYSAHLAIQHRKQARKDLGIVRGVMSRTVVEE